MTKKMIKEKKKKVEEKNKEIIKIYEPMLECYIYIYIWDKKSEYEKIIQEASNNPEYRNNPDSDGVACPRWVYINWQLSFIMWIEEANNISVFMHELYHLVSAVDREYNIWEEACAFLVGYVVREFNKIF